MNEVVTWCPAGSPCVILPLTSCHPQRMLLGDSQEMLPPVVEQFTQVLRYSHIQETNFTGYVEKICELKKTTKSKDILIMKYVKNFMLNIMVRCTLLTPSLYLASLYRSVRDWTREEGAWPGRSRVPRYSERGVAWRGSGQWAWLPWDKVELLGAWTETEGKRMS